MNSIISFFTESLTGIWYVVYIFVCLFFIFALIGVVGDRKKERSIKSMKEKIEKDLKDGRASNIAALEGKEIISLLEDQNKKIAEQNNMQQPSNDNNKVNENSIQNKTANIIPTVLVVDDEEKS